MSNQVTIEQRLATLEQTVADLKRQIIGVPVSSNWLEKITGSISDEAVFLEALEYGRLIRHADKPKNEAAEAANQVAEISFDAMLLGETAQSTEEADK